MSNNNKISGRLQVLSETPRYLGLFLLALGMLITAYAVFNISFTQTLCDEGSSPQPTQGCGYIPELVMFGWGPNNQYPIVMAGLFLIYAGVAIMFVRWVMIRAIMKAKSRKDATATLLAS